ncbi:cytochrome bd-I ubiquinol oxidase subunit 2 apoprotein [Rhodopseudomonas thermotolerans]|uniref:Cytochrome bd-I ubiquinol oxidase subunit 2 apoprotein n=2 Tax=Rhodopseudomonas TaxID=1073 RepID=A0A336JP98_9BRAD|nr:MULTISPECIES: cytochrome d ubiquinol oxidase subunit II [Rhodopseudomonas]RED33286.1 cytochrome bd-I ubiquinol oxidase subunit 2 apoprotein [Rhodopseudomonas pentothenatexigens]REF94035.1 cytochrome bd-I ubiquinol oxidase subunit 2 apoprotein [Rhodopseudomonas thermotolerans]SSW91362.1 cytochrome bd-I ubiquinol oxidase subunit 2 apoprotein [Rhodopseudomonas pentothenatexigens]
MLDYETLKFVWWIFVGLLLMGFAITDGMDMGVGTLLPFVARKDVERRIAINSVGPHWDGNQVWFITAGGAIFAAWPAVYAAAFSGFYMAMLLVLFALFFRPVGFDYRSKIENPTWRNAWDWGLFAGGTIPALIFGVAFGNLLQGVPFRLDELLRAHYQGSLLTALLPLLNPFALLAGVISLAMLAAHGGVWLQLRASDAVADRARKAVLLLSPIVAVAFALAGVWLWLGIDGYRIVKEAAHSAASNPLTKEVVRAPGAWLDIYAKQPLAMIVPAIGLIAPLLTMLLAAVHRPGLAFVTSAFGMVGIIGTAGLSMFPFIMPSSIDPRSSLTIWDAASSELTLTVMFWAVVIFLPIVLGYTVWCYANMWGRVTAGEIEARAHSAY